MLNEVNTPVTDRERGDAIEDEIKTLPHALDSIPLIVGIALVDSKLEKSTYIATTAQ